MLRSKVNSLGNPYSETWMRKRKGWGREDLLPYQSSVPGRPLVWKKLEMSQNLTKCQRDFWGKKSCQGKPSTAHFDFVITSVFSGLLQAFFEDCFLLIKSYETFCSYVYHAFSALSYLLLLVFHHPLTLGLNPSFSANPPYPSLSFFSFRFHYMDFPDCLLYFWAYPSFYFLVFQFLHFFSCRFHAVD